MSATSTITVGCPRCDGPAIVTLTTLGPDGDHIVEFACSRGDAITGGEAMQLWEAAHAQRPPHEGMSCPRSPA